MALQMTKFRVTRGNVFDVIINFPKKTHLLSTSKIERLLDNALKFKAVNMYIYMELYSKTIY